MPRPPRVYIEEALYYVTNQGIPGQNIFNDKEDYLMYAEILNKYKAQHQFKLFAFSLLPSGVHLLLETNPQATLSDIMHNITSSYIKYYNRKYKRQGHLFRGRFRATIIEKEPNLARLVRYIHLIPKRQGISAEQAGYPYSSVLYYLPIKEAPQGFKINMDADVEEVRSSVHADILSGEQITKDDEWLSQNMPRKVFFGSQEFGNRIRQKMEEAVTQESESEIGVVRNRSVSKPFVIGVSGAVLAALAGSVLFMSSKSKKQPEVRPVIVSNQTVAPADVPVTEPAIPFEIVGLDGSSWQIKFVAGTPFMTVDILEFEKGKMKSENMELNGYPASNYSTSKEELRVIWETMQTSAAGTANWRGEVEGGKMRGVLSLRAAEGEPKDFSFVSVRYIKIDQKTERPDSLWNSLDAGRTVDAVRK